MKTTYSVILAALFSAFILTSCDEDDTVNFEQDINVTIQGIVYNNDGNTTLGGVEVTLGTTTATTDSTGVYSFTGNSSGSYLLKFVKSGYATMVQSVEEGGREFTANAIVNTSPIFMFATDQTLTTKLSTSNGTETKPAASVEVKLEVESFSGSIFFEQNVFTATTDANGSITVENLPNQPIDLSVSYVEGENKFSTLQTSTPGNFGVSYVLAKESLAEFKLVSSNLINAEGNAEDKFNGSDNITFEFSDDIATDFAAAKIELDKSNRSIVISHTISGGTLTIDPRGNALASGEEYEVELFLKSVNGKQYYRFFSFTVEGGTLNLAQVTGLTLDEFHNTTQIAETTTNVNIEFNEVDDADSYEVYGKFSGGTDEFILLNSYTVSEVAGEEDNAIELGVSLLQTGIEVPTDGYFDGTGSFTLIVRAKTGTTFGAFSSELTFKDGDGN